MGRVSDRDTRAAQRTHSGCMSWTQSGTAGKGEHFLQPLPAARCGGSVGAGLALSSAGVLSGESDDLRSGEGRGGGR